MATYKKQLKDKDGNTIYPDVGLNLDDVVYSDDPTQITTPEPWVGTGDITNNAVTADKINWSTIKSPFPLGQTITEYGTVTATTTITPSENCFLVGKSVVLGGSAAAEVSTSVNGNNRIIAGIPYWDGNISNPNMQVGICLLLKKGQSYTLRASNGGRFEQLRTVKIVWA